MRAGDSYQQAVDAVEAQGVAAAGKVSALPEGNYRLRAAGRGTAFSAQAHLLETLGRDQADE